jgi:hypothetical protein
MLDDATLDRSADRRVHRTENALEALTRLVEASRRRAGAQAVAVSDRTGLLLASAGAHRLCEELAAWAPLMGHPADNDVVPSFLDCFEGRTSLRRLAVDGIEIVVSFSGSREDEKNELDAVSAGCARILRQR